MMLVGILVVLFLLFLLFQRRRNNCYLLLVLLQIASIGMGGFVGQYIQFDSLKTYFNILFVFLNIYLIVSPWRFAQFQIIGLNSVSGFGKLSRTLDYTLRIALVADTMVFVGVLLFVPDIAQFKNEHGFKELYDSIPYFSTVFRVCAMTQYVGYFAIPISAYYLQQGDKKKSLKFFILSMSSLVGALALYSRAGILTFFLTTVSFYLLVFTVFNKELQQKIKKVILRSSIIIIAVFLTITVVRFSAMPWYGDRIPAASKIQNPIAYNIFDYASQGFTNGINQLELHSSSDVLNGENNMYLVYQTLAFFNLSNWTSDEASERYEKAYTKNGLDEQNDPGAFHGYTCRLVKDFGYILTLFINICYYLYVKKKTKKRIIDVNSLFFLMLLITQPCVSIFYTTYGEILFPFIFIVALMFLSRFSTKKSVPVYS